MTQDERQFPEDRAFNLEKRTARFGEAVIALAKKAPTSEVNRPLICQLVRAATSVGANYSEADGAGSRMKFLSNQSVQTRNANIETLIANDRGRGPDLKSDSRIHLQKTKELHLIFAAIHRYSRQAKN